VESQFIKPLYLGRTMVPFRCLESYLAVVPWDGNKLLSGADPDLDRYPGLQAWWRRAEQLWNEHRRSERLSLLQRVDYQHGLSGQFPSPPHRVVYNGSGQYLAAARVSNPEAIIEHKLYWAPCRSEEEALYVVGVLNSPVVTELSAPLQSRGEHNPRDFDKIVFQLPIPRYDPESALHVRLVALARRAEGIVALLEFPESKRFEALRRQCREALETEGLLGEIDQVVRLVLAEVGLDRA
jgi:hypothetical protein